MSPPPSDDREAAYQEIASAHAAAIARLATAYERDPGRAEDLVQEIFLALWRALPSFEGRCSLRTWVYRVAHNVGATHILRARRDQSRSWVALEDVVLEDGSPSGERTVQIAELGSCIASLKPLDRQIVVSWLEGLTAEEIADVTGLSADHVGVKVHRLRQLLAKQMEGAS